jgi:surface protein
MSTINITDYLYIDPSNNITIKFNVTTFLANNTNYANQNAIITAINGGTTFSGILNSVTYKLVTNNTIRTGNQHLTTPQTLCTTLVTDMTSLYNFSNLSNTNPNRLFNGNVTRWDTSNVTTMQAMFRGALEFNQNISNWDTSNVTTMNSMFYDANKFNQPIGSWNTSNVTNMNSMFRNCDINQPIGSWNTSNVTNMGFMFYRSVLFNHPIDSWDTSKVIIMNSMFFYAKSFNQPIGSWNTSNVTNMNSMFYDADNFNQDISKWNTSNVTNMNSMFYYTGGPNVSPRVFNQDIRYWIVKPETILTNMFYNAQLFKTTYSVGDTPDYTFFNKVRPSPVLDLFLSATPSTPVVVIPAGISTVEIPAGTYFLEKIITTSDTAVSIKTTDGVLIFRYIE